MKNKRVRGKHREICKEERRRRGKIEMKSESERYRR